MVVQKGIEKTWKEPVMTKYEVWSE